MFIWGNNEKCSFVRSSHLALLLLQCSRSTPAWTSLTSFARWSILNAISVFLWGTGIFSLYLFIIAPQILRKSLRIGLNHSSWCCYQSRCIGLFYCKLLFPFLETFLYLYPFIQGTPLHPNNHGQEQKHHQPDSICAFHLFMFLPHSS